MTRLPHDIHEIYEHYLESPLGTPGALRSLVHAHRDKAEYHAERLKHIDGELVEGIAGACLKLLDLWTGSDEPTCRAIQAAVLYFADDKDEEDDFATIAGFDDDALVVNHVCELVGHVEWRVTIPARPA